MFGVRVVSYWSVKGFAGSKLKKPEDLFQLDIDRDIRRRKIAKMKPIKVVKEDGKQPNS